MLRITIVCSDPCDGFPCFECELMEEAIALAVKGTPAREPEVEFAHRSVQEACDAWEGGDFNDLDAPYFVVNDEVKLHGRAWRAAKVDNVVSLMTQAWTRQ